MIRSWIKKSSIVLIVLFMLLIMSGDTNAIFIAKRAVIDNIFSVISLDITTRKSFNNEIRSKLFDDEGFLPGGFDVASIKVKNDSDHNIKYNVRVEIANGDIGLCDALHAKVYSSDMTLKYSGTLTDMYFNSSLGARDSFGFIFLLSFDSFDSSLTEKMCEFDIDVKTYRNDPNEGTGIYAQRYVGNTITTGNW